MSFHLDMVDLRLMVNTADTESLTKGAERSYLSLPSASVRIKKLEDAAEVRLFERKPRGFALTPAGRALVHHARVVLHQLDELFGELKEYAKGIKGHLRIAASTASLTEFLPEVIQSFMQEYPDISVDLKARPMLDVVRSIQDRRADVGLVSGSVELQGLTAIPYYLDRLVVVVPKDHAMANRRQVQFEETLPLAHVSLCERSELYAFVRARARDLGQPLDLRLQVSDIEAACSMVEAGIGIGVLPELAAMRHLKSKRIALVPLAEEWAAREMLICVRAGEDAPAYLLSLTNRLIEHARIFRTGTLPHNEPAYTSFATRAG